MRRVLICAAVAAATWAAPLGLQAPLAQTPAAAAPGTVARVIVKFKPGSALLRKQTLSVTSQQSQQAAALGQRVGIALEAGRGLSDRSHVVIGRGLSSKQLAARLAGESDVEFAFADERKHIVAVPNDTLYASVPAPTATTGGPVVGQWYLKPPPPAGSASATWGSTAPSAINAERAWDITTGSASVVVAVLDTGLRFDHSDLQGGNVVPGYDMVSEDSVGVFTSANDRDGRDGDASDPGDFVTVAEAGTLGCTDTPSSWHGTQTLGLIGAATNNGVGMASVSRTVRVMPVRVLGKCGGYDSDIQAGMLWAAGIPVPGTSANPTPARVLNMSLGGVAACGSYADIIAQVNAAGAVVVVAAGNGGTAAVSSPANCPGAVGVAGLRHAGDMVGYSDEGPEISIAAPAGNCVDTGSGACLYPILTTTNTGTTTPVPGPPGATYTDGASASASVGTSFSAPLVAGTAALMLSVNPSLTPAQVKAKLQSTARQFPTTGGVADAPVCPARHPTSGGCYCTTLTCGAGMLDAHAAVLSVSGVQAAISLQTTTPTAGEAVSLTSASTLTAGQSIASYDWTILNAGTSGATITSATNADSVVVSPTAAGSFVIQLTTTDNNGFVSTTTLRVAVEAPPAPPAPPASAPAPSGGGGALGVGWLLLLLAAVFSLALVSARERALLSASAARRGRTD